ncbi:MAG: efflux RND transporter permease subunit, partial [Syntrophobacteraceae bacterium]|nr:efflux RND transporter permease subunit [Syntrophobacteraceae bacterium]
PGLDVAGKEQSIQALERPRAFSSFLPMLDAEGTYIRFEEKQRVVQAHRNNELGVFDEDFLEGGLVLRLRPVLMTTVSTFVGMLPIILETAIGLERMSPLASAAGFGLLVGTFMTMVVAPVMYSVLDDAKTSWRSHWKRM